MGKERVEMSLDRQMYNLLEMSVVEVSKYPEEMFVDMLGGVRE